MRKYFNYPRGKQLAALKIYGGKEEHKTVGLQFEPEEALRLAISLLLATQEGKTIDVTAYKTPRSDGKYKVTVTAQLIT
jgi:hypothetical protein